MNADYSIRVRFLLTITGITCSMKDGYDCYQNALAERVSEILRMEFLVIKPEDIKQARKMVRESVEIYNTQPPSVAKIQNAR